MTAADSIFGGSIPALYDQYLGSLIFEPYAAILATRLAELNPKRVLETAAGTGIVTRELARVLPKSVAITATDLNQPMVDFAAGQMAAERVSWRQADAQSLPFEDGAFDAVVCQFGVMFFPDRLAAYREARRVLKPKGRIVFDVWDRIEDNEFANITQGAVAALFPDDPPQFLARTPHGYFETSRLRSELEAAGFTNIALETIVARSRAPSPRDPAIGYCQGTPLRNEIEARDKDRLGEATDTAASAIAKRFGTGAVDAKIQAHVIVAVRAG
jgi:ubiquinone/menaquinone biosynthesis C-methylase UbiE